MAKPEVLVIVANDQRRQQIEDRLSRVGCTVSSASDAQQGIQQALLGSPDVIMLDQDLPGTDSLEICRRIRHQSRTGTEPAFLLTPDWNSHTTAMSDTDQAKVARRWEGIQALLGWSETEDANWTCVRRMGLEMDLKRHWAELDGRELSLTPMEFRLLWTLASDPGNVYERDQLSRLCHGGKGTRRARTIDVHIRAIRAKMGDKASLLQTVHGIGYRFREANSRGQTSSTELAACEQG